MLAERKVISLISSAVKNDLVKMTLKVESRGGTEPGSARFWLGSARFFGSSARARLVSLWLVK